MMGETYGAELHIRAVGIVIARGKLVAILREHPAAPAAIVAEVRERLDITDEQLRTGA